MNASDKLSEADKYELQQYIKQCYGSLTAFNIRFKNKNDQSQASRDGPAERLSNTSFLRLGSGSLRSRKVLYFFRYLRLNKP